MPRDYRRERDLIIERWYGRKPTGRNPGPRRSWADGPIRPEDGFGIENPVNHPFPLFGYCIAWRYTLDSDGYGTQTIDGGSEKVHRAVYRQTRGPIPDGLQINHLCDRPYCYQPSHLYAGTQQDNSDDSALFRAGSPISQWELANYFDREHSDDPFLQRMRETQRHDGTQPWDPVEQPPQVSWESFECEEHDFAIPMLSDTDDRICRICEEFEMSLGMDRDREVPALISELWPASQSVPELLDAIRNSEFAGDLTARQRRSAYYRSTLRVFGGTHRLRSCDCYLCGADRGSFREAMNGNLTTAMRMTLDLCNVLRKDIEDAVADACRRAMRQLGVAANLDDDQTGELVLHAGDCGEDRADSGAALVERVLGGATYAAFGGDGCEKALGQQWAQDILLLFGFLERFPDEEDEYLAAASGVARSLADELSGRWLDLLTDAAESENLPHSAEPDPLVVRVAAIGVAIHLVELFRFEARGKNTGSREWPHPHEGCIEQIRKTGRWEAEPGPSAFEEGRGYSRDDDPAGRFNEQDGPSESTHRR